MTGSGVTRLLIVSERGTTPSAPIRLTGFTALSAVDPEENHDVGAAGRTSRKGPLLRAHVWPNAQGCRKLSMQFCLLLLIILIFTPEMPA
jgi:hypothetical protein